MRRLFIAVFALLLSAPGALCAQVTAESLERRIDGLRALADRVRPAATTKIAIDLRRLPADPEKVKLADALARLSTEGDPGHTTLEAVATTLARALEESPQPDENDGSPARAYLDLARMLRYEGVTASPGDPHLMRASELLEANDADAAKADFTLLDTRGKSYTLSALKGKIVVVNFWATWCPPCRKEMKDLDALSLRLKARGLVVVSITSEGPDVVMPFLSSVVYRPAVLIDADGEVTKQFHVDSLPRTFVFDRQGKLAAEAIDMRTRRQFLRMLAKAGMPTGGNG